MIYAYKQKPESGFKFTTLVKDIPVKIASQLKWKCVSARWKPVEANAIIKSIGIMKTDNGVHNKIQTFS